MDDYEFLQKTKKRIYGGDIGDVYASERSQHRCLNSRKSLQNCCMPPFTLKSYSLSVRKT